MLLPKINAGGDDAADKDDDENDDEDVVAAGAYSTIPPSNPDADGEDDWEGETDNGAFPSSWFMGESSAPGNDNGENVLLCPDEEAIQEY